MKTCIITIGSEILDGSRLDTNSQWIAKKILNYGLIVEKFLSIGDNDISISNALKNSSKYDFIFITGGLGPTHDDLTLSSFAKFFDLKMNIDDKYLKNLGKKFSDGDINMPQINKNQALVLENTEILDNSLGTARGIYYKHLETNFFIMPGVPAEMYCMLKDVIIPSYLGNKINLSHKTIRTSGIAESKLAEKVENLMLDYAETCTFSFLPSYKGVDFILKTNLKNKAFENVIDKFYNAMKPYSFGYEDDSFLLFIINMLSNKKLSISLAESCTGGFLGKLFTDTPGSSKVFIGGVLAYSNSIKINQLNISKDKIEKLGAVNSEVAKDMAENVRNIFNSDIGISTTGIAGPSGDSKNKDVGLVYIAIAFKNKCISKKFNFNLNRDLNRKLSCYAALNMLRKIIYESN